MILRQLHTREQSHTESMLLSAGVSFPCLTLKYRRFTFFNHSVGEIKFSAPIQPRYLANSFFNLFSDLSRQVHHESAGVWSFLLFIQILPFYSFQTKGGGTPASCPYPTALFGEQPFQPVSQFLMYAKYTASPENRGFRASHPNIAVLQFSNKGRGELQLLASIQPRYLANSVSTCFTIPHVRKVHHES